MEITGPWINFLRNGLKAVTCTWLSLSEGDIGSLMAEFIFVNYTTISNSIVSIYR
jgi:hypothetical protein